jgi:2-alkyl-3-oxoalkanoate reductase
MTLQGKTALVTGATGFVGGALARRLASEGTQVRALARRPERDGYIRDAAGIEIVSGDVTDAARMRKLAQGCDYVFHAAAVTMGLLEVQRTVNVHGTRNVAEAAGLAGVGRFVHVSTIAVYGYRIHGDITEDTPLDPGNDPYGITKAEAEAAVGETAADHGLAYSIVRPGMIYGPRSGPWTRGVFSLARRKPTIFVGDGSGSAFPIHIDDVVDLLLTVAAHPAAAGKTFNATPDPSPTWREFLGAYSALAGHNRWLGIPPALLTPVVGLVGLFAPKNHQVKDLPDMLRFAQRTTTYRMDKARDLLGWQPKVALADGIESCVPYLREKGMLS